MELKLGPGSTYRLEMLHKLTTASVALCLLLSPCQPHPHSHTPPLQTHTRTPSAQCTQLWPLWTCTRNSLLPPPHLHRQPTQPPHTRAPTPPHPTHPVPISLHPCSLGRCDCSRGTRGRQAVGHPRKGCAQQVACGAGLWGLFLTFKGPYSTICVWSEKHSSSFTLLYLPPGMMWCYRSMSCNKNTGAAPTWRSQGDCVGGGILDLAPVLVLDLSVSTRSRKPV